MTTDELVDSFALALKAKLAASAVKYGYSTNWQRDDWQAELCVKLLDHVRKGDPRDVAAYCAFAWYHGWPTTPPKEPSPESVMDCQSSADVVRFALDQSRMSRLVKPQMTKPTREGMTDGEYVAMAARTRWIIDLVESLRPESYPNNASEAQFVAGEKHMTDAVLEKLWEIVIINPAHVTNLTTIHAEYDGNLRYQMQEWTPAEKAIDEAMVAVESAGAGLHLTNATRLLSQARQAVARHVLAASSTPDDESST